jgi:hypothetical protein
VVENTTKEDGEMTESPEYKAAFIKEMEARAERTLAEARLINAQAHAQELMNKKEMPK